MVTVPQGSSIDEAITAHNGQNIAVYDETAVREVTTGGWSDTPDFDQNEIGFPKLRLAQGLSPEVASGDAKMGQWLFSGYDPFDSVIIVPLLFSRTRSKRVDPANRDSDIACESGDARIGMGDPGGNCQTCPFARWGSDPKSGQRKPPACQISYHYAVYISEVDTVGEMIFTRTSEATATLINNAIVRFGMGRFAMQVESIQKQGGGGRRWAEPRIKLVDLTPDLIEGIRRAGFGGPAPVSPSIQEVPVEA